MALHDFHFSSSTNNNNNNNNNTNIMDTNNNNIASTTIVLTNGMYSHVIDALAKSPHLYRIVLSDILLRQFILLYINRMDCKGIAAAAAAAAADVNLNNDDDDAISQQVMLSSVVELRPIITTLQCPSGLLWKPFGMIKIVIIIPI
jgi:hypothetical protein